MPLETKSSLPLYGRPATIFFEYASPMPGSSLSWTAVALFRSTRALALAAALAGAADFAGALSVLLVCAPAGTAMKIATRQASSESSTLCFCIPSVYIAKDGYARRARLLSLLGWSRAGCRRQNSQARARFCGIRVVRIRFQEGPVCGDRLLITLGMLILDALHIHCIGSLGTVRIPLRHRLKHLR